MAGAGCDSGSAWAITALTGVKPLLRHHGAGRSATHTDLVPV
jgi:hypothetical protein